MKSNRYLIFSIALYVLALFLPGYNGSKDESEGFYLVFFGWTNLMYGGANFAWLANPAIWFAWIRSNNNSLSLIASLFATAFCLYFLLFSNVSGAGLCGSGFLDSYPCDEKIKEINSGYFLWTLSIVVMLVGNIKTYKKNIANKS